MIYNNNASSINEKLQIKIALEKDLLDEFEDQDEKIEQYIDDSDYYRHFADLDEIVDYFDDQEIDSTELLDLCSDCKKHEYWDKLYYAENKISCIHQLSEGLSFSDCYPDIDNIEKFFNDENNSIENNHSIKGLNADSFIERYDRRECKLHFICPSCLQKSFFLISCERTKELIDNSDSDALVICEDCLTSELTESRIANIEAFEHELLSEHYRKARELRNKKRFHYQYYKIKQQQSNDWSKYSSQLNYYLNYKSQTLNSFDLMYIEQFMTIF
jgi:hypothetical protein